jgi:signal transduction histidine kinase
LVLHCYPGSMGKTSEKRNGELVMLDNYGFGIDMSRTNAENKRNISHLHQYSGVTEVLFDSIGRGVIFITPEGIVKYMNTAAERMLHAERGSVIGKKVYMLPLRTPIYRVMSETCRDFPVDVAVMGRVYAVQASEVRNSHGEVLGEMTEIWDISDQRKEKRQGEEFVAMITHDLKSPVTVINGYLQMLKMGVYGPLSEPLENVVDQMDQSGERLLSMIEELLEVYQMEMGNIKINRGIHDIGNILGICYRDHIKGARDKGLIFTLSVEEGLPPANLDEKQLLRVFNNLVGNAVKFTPSGGEVSLSVMVSDGNLIVHVDDTGIGIPLKDIPRVFNKYFRSKSASGYKGTGLGLAISRAIVEGHGGAITLDSTEGHGSRFTVMIPLVDD